MSEILETKPIAPRPAHRSWLVVALIISVAFNLFALGFVAARALRPEGGRAGHGPFMGPHGLMHDGFGPQAEPMIDAIMAKHGEGLRMQRRELRQARKAVRDALLNEPFDPGRLEQAFAGLRARTESSQASMHEALVELARSLPADQRKRLARRALALEALGMDGPRPGRPEGP